MLTDAVHTREGWRGKPKTSTYQDVTTPDGGDKCFQVRGSNEVTFTKAVINSAFFICKTQMRTYFFFFFFCNLIPLHTGTGKY